MNYNEVVSMNSQDRLWFLKRLEKQKEKEKKRNGERITNGF